MLHLTCLATAASARCGLVARSDERTFIERQLIDSSFPQPVQVDAEEDRGALLLHFAVDGKDRVFFVDSGAYNSSYDPKVWKTPKGGEPLTLNVFAGGKQIASVKPIASDGLPLYGSTATRPVGILGLDFFGQVVVFFDRRSSKAWLFPSSKADARSVLAHSDAFSSTSVTDGVIHAQNLPWTIVDSPPDVHSRLVTKFSVAGKELFGSLDCGCSWTGIAVAKLQTLDHWKYGEWATALWDRTVAEALLLVPDLKLPFMESEIASVNDVIDGDGVDAWIGDDVLNAGRWIMDVNHRQFAFQPYVKQSPYVVHLPGSELLLNRDASFELRPSFRLRTVGKVVDIDGAPPNKVLGDLSTAGGAEAFAPKLAPKLAAVLSRSFTMNVASGDATWHCVFRPWKREKLDSIADLAAKNAKESNNIALAIKYGSPGASTKQVKAPTLKDAKGAIVRPVQSNGPVTVPQGTTFDPGEWAVNHTDRGTVLLTPPGWDAADGQESVLYVLRNAVKNPIKMTLPEPGGSIRVPASDMFIGPADWDWSPQADGGFIVHRPASEPAERADQNATWLGNVGGSLTLVNIRHAKEKIAVGAGSIIEAPSGWHIGLSDSKVPFIAKGPAGGDPKPSANAPGVFKSGQFLIHTPTTGGGSSPSDTVLLAPRGWAIVRASSGRVLLVSPAGATTVIVAG